MNAEYVTACIQKAAALRKHDTELWLKYTLRVLELRDEFSPEQLGYILWGCGKSGYRNVLLYNNLLPVVQSKLPMMQSHALMSLMWCMKRIRWMGPELLRATARHAAESHASIRPSDFIKIANALAILGMTDQGLAGAISRVAIPKFEETFAQQFRDAVHPVAIGALWSAEVSTYILERFRRIFITARPMHLMKAYEAAVVCRVHSPKTWRSLSREAKQFYVRLSQRQIPDKGQEPSAMHWEVSKLLAELGEAHRNCFRWGPFLIDIGLEELETDERRRCLMIDGPGAFFHSSDQYLPSRQLQHGTLASLGWDVRRVRWDDWAALGHDVDRKRSFLRDVLARSRPTDESLQNRPARSPTEVWALLRTFRDALRENAEASCLAEDEEKIDFDI
jgi:hypothetical protein